MKKVLLCLAFIFTINNPSLADVDHLTKCTTLIKESNFSDAVQFCDKSCSLNSTVGCIKLGTLYEEGHGVKQSYKQAKKYYDKACNLGDEDGCFYYNALAVDGY